MSTRFHAHILAAAGLLTLASAAFAGGSPARADGTTIDAVVAANAGAGSVSVLSAVDGSDLATVTGLTTPTEVVVHPTGSTIYVVERDDNAVAVIDTATYTVAETIVGFDEPSALAITGDGATLYVANRLGGTVSIVDTTTNTIAGTVAGFTNPTGLVLSPDDGVLYVADSTGGAVSAVDTSTSTVTSLASVTGPLRLAISGDGATLYVSATDGATGTVEVVDTSTMVATDTIAGLTTPWTLVLAGGGTTLFVADTGADTIQVVDLASGSVASSFGSYDNVYGVALSSDEQTLYVADYTGSVVAFIDADPTSVGYLTVDSTSSVGANTVGIAYGVVPAGTPATTTTTVAPTTTTTTVAPTTTTTLPGATTTLPAPTTTAPAPKPVPGPNGSLPDLDPGDVQVYDGAQPRTPRIISPRSNVISVEDTGYMYEISGTCQGAPCPVTADGDGRFTLAVRQDGRITVSGNGLVAGSTAQVWLFSEPTRLGSVNVKADGSYAESFEIIGLSVGNHTLQINGTTLSGATRTLNLGVRVTEGAGGSGGGLPDTGSSALVRVLVGIGLLAAAGALIARGRRHAI